MANMAPHPVKAIQSPNVRAYVLNDVVVPIAYDASN
jgi:hypothetical protein